MMPDDMDIENPGASPKEFDFSADMNIRPVSDADEQSSAPLRPLPKSVSEEVSKSLSQMMTGKPTAPMVPPGAPRIPSAPVVSPVPTAPIKPIPTPIMPVTPAASPKMPTPGPYRSTPDPFREPIGKLDAEWPFASPETLAKNKLRETPAAAPAPAVVPVSAPATPAPTPVSTPLPTPGLTPAQAAPVHPSILKNLRTYESDIADVLAHRGTSTASMAIAENKKRGDGESLRNVVKAPKLDLGEPKEKTHFGLKLTAVIVSLLLIAGGAIGGYYLYQQSPLGTETPVAATVTPKASSALVPYDSQTVINIDALKRADIISRVKTELGKQQVPDTIREIVMTETKDGTTYRVSALEMAAITGVPVPDIISRTLKPEWMLGIYSSSGGTESPFVVVSTNLFQNAFAGMLAWEQAIPEDLKTFLTGSSDPSIPAPQGGFKDQIVKNKDVRAFVSDNGRTLMEYSFTDNSTLIFTANNSALSAIITRLENKAFLR